MIMNINELKKDTVCDECNKLKNIVLNDIDETLTEFGDKRINLISKAFETYYNYYLHIQHLNNSYIMEIKETFVKKLKEFYKEPKIQSISIEYLQKIGEYYKSCVVCHDPFMQRNCTIGNRICDKHNKIPKELLDKIIRNNKCIYSKIPFIMQNRIQQCKNYIFKDNDFQTCRQHHPINSTRRELTKYIIKDLANLVIEYHFKDNTNVNELLENLELPKNYDIFLKNILINNVIMMEYEYIMYYYGRFTSSKTDGDIKQIIFYLFNRKECSKGTILFLFNKLKPDSKEIILSYSYKNNLPIFLDLLKNDLKNRYEKIDFQNFDICFKN